MTFIGRISYPLYLWHWPLFSFTRIVLGHPAQPAMAAGEIVIALAAAYATYRWVEVPIRYGELGRKAVPALLAGLALLAVAGVALQARWITGRLSGPIILRMGRRRQRLAFFRRQPHRRTNRIRDTHRDQPPGPQSPVHRRLAHPAVLAPREANHRRASRLRAIRRICQLSRMASAAGHQHICIARHNSSGFFDHAMELAFRPDVDTVVIGAFWEFYFLGEYPPERYVQDVYGVPPFARAPLQLDSPSTQAAFEQFQRDISRLVSSGRRVFIVLSNPTSPLFEPVFPTEIRLSLHPPRQPSQRRRAPHRCGALRVVRGAGTEPIARNRRGRRARSWSILA